MEPAQLPHALPLQLRGRLPAVVSSRSGRQAWRGGMQAAADAGGKLEVLSSLHYFNTNQILLAAIHQMRGSCHPLAGLGARSGRAAAAAAARGWMAAATTRVLRRLRRRC